LPKLRHAVLKVYGGDRGEVATSRIFSFLVFRIRNKPTNKLQSLQETISEMWTKVNRFPDVKEIYENVTYAQKLTEVTLV